jgi:1-acyl-sn-glycerol-3-phosphate acyltransferase
MAEQAEGGRPSPWRKEYRRDRDLPWARSPAARAVRSGLLNFVIGPIFRYYGRPTVFGVENLRLVKPPFLLAANHSSHLDTPAILLALPPRLRRRTLVAAAADYFFDEAWKGALVALAVGAIAVERERPPRQSMKLVRRLLADGWNLVVFPEGGRSADGRLHRGKRGIAHLAAASGVPVVPVGVVGTFAALPAGYHWPRRAQVEVHFGAPLFTDGHPKPGPGPGGLRNATEGIMASIQALTGQELAGEGAAAGASSHITSG